MSKRGETGWVGKNQLPPPIPPYKTPRQLRQLQKQDKSEASVTECVRKDVIYVLESERQDVVDVSESE